MAECCDCKRKLPVVPGLLLRVVAHVAGGRPCLDGKKESPHETCTEWGIQFAADRDWPADDGGTPEMRRRAWQEQNLTELDV